MQSSITILRRSLFVRAIFLPPALLFVNAAGSNAAVDFAVQFEKEVRPLLDEHCFRCHGPEKQKGGLRMDRKADLMSGGDSGEPAIVLGKGVESQLIARMRTSKSDEMMPPKGERMTPEQIAAIQRWIDNGAHWPSSGKPDAEVATKTNSGPSGKVITDKDREFWSFKLPQRSQPAVTAQKGWPRQPLDFFIASALAKNGLTPAPEASSVVLIRRVTYDLTGLPPTPEEVDAFVQSASRNPQAAIEALVDRLLASPRFGERMASMWLPLARYAEDQAHQVGKDTKFFYPNAYHYRAWVIEAFNHGLPYDQFVKLQLAADRLPGTAPGDLAALGFLGLGPKYYNRGRLDVMADEWEDRVDTVSRALLGLTVACARCHDHKFDPISMRDYYALAGVFASTSMVNKTPDGKVAKDGKAADVDPAMLHLVEDAKPQDLNVFLRGNVESKGPIVERRFLEVLSKRDASAFSDGSGRRELAERIASSENPLTARVFVNRVWALLLGQPLVSTPSNFGHSGALPTHPELLDDLARRFMDGGWSVKALVREIVLSATYRQASACDDAKLVRDPSNRFFSRMNRRRLTFEQWRDSVLAHSGRLTESVGAKSADIDSPDNSSRTVYAFVSRLKLSEQLMRFDYPDANVHSEQRSVTTTPLQKLFMLNSPFMLKHAAALAARLQAGASDDTTRVANAYRMLLAREPDDSERALAAEFLKRPSSSSGMTRWDQYAQILLISNPMLYVD
ncbi:MAG: PSD1 and planctomycete cytochrome C domain-containing protein [Chthoniobacteraceae bacterium]